MSSTVISKTTARSPAAGSDRSFAVPTRDLEDQSNNAPDQPFAEGAQDTLDPDLRHRMISESAYHRYVERGFADGYDLDDWLEAETAVDHALLDWNRA